MPISFGTNLIIAGINGLGFAVSLLISHSYGSKLNFLSGIKELPLNNISEPVSDQKSPICYAHVTLNTDNPIKPEHSNHEWLIVTTAELDRYGGMGATPLGLGTMYSTRAMDKGTRTIEVSNINPHGDTDLNNILSLINEKYGVTEKLRCEEQNENKLFAHPYHVNRFKEFEYASKEIDYLGKAWNHSGILNDGAKYLIIAKHDGKKFIVDKRITIEKDRSMEEIKADLKNKKEYSKYCSIGFALLGTFFGLNSIRSRL